MKEVKRKRWTMPEARRRCRRDGGPWWVLVDADRSSTLSCCNEAGSAARRLAVSASVSSLGRPRRR